MPNHTTPTPDGKGASDNIGDAPLTDLQSQLSRHETYQERVKRINAALRSARVRMSDADAQERAREVLRSVLGEERLVEMYFRQLWQFSQGQSRPKFPTSVLTKNNVKIRQLRASVAASEADGARAHSDEEEARAPRPTTISRKEINHGQD